ncbi:SUV39H2 isoform 1 [Pan troglodytes]|uniref:SUV39H2 isoform 1 n=1 Tax=Pan troglodytes TaxID=9598 RepID=A0A2J8QJH4_PANTR|nr:SUV39H2 isoform 1 [Pan troglodytes]
MAAVGAERRGGYGILSCKMERMARFYKYLGTFAKSEVPVTASAIL